MLAIGMPGTTELLILLGVLLLLFGSTRLPSLMRSLGRSVTEFKAGLGDEPQTTKAIENGGSTKADPHAPSAQNRT